VFSSKESGVERGAISLTAGTALTNTGAFTSSTTSQAADATFSLSGLGGTVRRSSNTVSDILPGVTLNIGSLGTTTISVKTDSSKTAKGVADFVDRFNRIISYTKEQNTVTFEGDSKDATPTFAPLSSTQIDEGLVSAIRSGVRSSRSGRSSAIATLADMGITTARDGTLSLDSKKLDAAIANDSGSVEQLLQQLGDTLAAPGGAIDQFTRFGGQFDSLKQANNRQIDSYNRRAESAEKILSRQEDEMRTRFSRLESLMGGLQQQQMALSSLVRR
jgi:flagellar hook-associated protein 2